MTDTTTTITTQRDAVIAEHIAAECEHDVDRALATFHSAHYHVYPLGIDAPGDEAVRGLLEAVFTAFPDFRFTAERSYYADDAVIVEGRITGTQDGDWAGVAPTGRSVDVPTCCIYHFDDDRLTSESVYFDHSTLLSQLGQ
jgi:steroid delta-isomerase-like uncharacterized protein